MLQLFNRKVSAGNFDKPDLWSEDEKKYFKYLSFRPMTVGKTDKWEAFEPIFPGLGHLYAPLWEDLEKKILSTLRLNDGRGTLFNTLLVVSGRIVYLPFRRSYHDVGPGIVSGVYFSKMGSIKLTELMLLNANNTPDDYLAKWSGIPASKLDAVYDGGVAYLKSIIESVARDEASRKRGHTVIYYPRPEEKKNILKPGWTPVED